MTHFTLNGVPKGAPSAPLVLDSPHSGTQYPDDFNYAVEFMSLRQAEDTHVEKLYSFGNELGIPMIYAHFPRSYIDLNRSRFEIDQKLLDQPWIGKINTTDKVELGKGLIWRMLDDGQPIYQRQLPLAEVENRINEYWIPYHSALRNLIESVHQKFGFVLHLNCHSMPSVSDKYSTNHPGLVHPDIVLGDRDGQSADPLITEELANQFKQLGYSCWINKPYKGVELVKSYSNPILGKHSIQIEINRRLYMNEHTRELNDGFNQLVVNLRKVIEHMVKSSKQRIK